MIPTIKIANTQHKGPSPFLIINASDFDPAKHKEYDDSVREQTVAKQSSDASKPWNDAMSATDLAGVGKKVYGLDLNFRAGKEALQAELQKAWEAEKTK
jgi:hypothetical protein